MAKSDAYYVEKREQYGDYAVRRRGGQRASDVLPTQREALRRAKELNEGAGVDVERVRNVKRASRNKWLGG